MMHEARIKNNSYYLHLPDTQEFENVSFVKIPLSFAHIIVFVIDRMLQNYIWC